MILGLIWLWLMAVVGYKLGRREPQCVGLATLATERPTDFSGEPGLIIRYRR